MASAADYKGLKVGDEVNAWCTKCLEMRMHKIKSIDPKGEKVPRVVCLCPEKTERNYRPHPPKSRMKKQAKARPTDGANPWRSMREGADITQARVYTIHEHFITGDVIDHRRYGIGFVLEILDATKILVACEDKKRMMVCNK